MTLSNLEIEIEKVEDDRYNKSSDYDQLTPLDWFEYQFATLEYDYKIHPIAADNIRKLVKHLVEETK